MAFSPVINACAIMKIYGISIFTVTTVLYLVFCVLLFNIVDHQVTVESFIHGNMYIFPKMLSNITIYDINSKMSIFFSNNYNINVESSSSHNNIFLSICPCFLFHKVITMTEKRYTYACKVGVT